MLAVSLGNPGTKSGVTTYTNTRTVVATSVAQNGWTVNYSWQRKLFWAVGLYWLFYADGQNGQVYRTSANGTTWSSPTTVRGEDPLGHRIAYTFDGTNIHYAANV